MTGAFTKHGVRTPSPVDAVHGGRRGSTRPDPMLAGASNRMGDGSADAPLAPRPRPSWAAIGIFVILLVGSLAYARFFLTPVLLAFFLALIFSPVRRTLGRTGLPDGAAAAAIVAGLTALLLTAGYLLVTPVLGWVSDAPEIGQRLEERVRDIRSTLSVDGTGDGLEEAVRDVRDAVAPGSGDEPTVVVESVGVTQRLIGLVPVVGVQTALVLVLLFFLLASGDMFYEKTVHAISRFRDKRRAMRTVHDIERRLSRYLLTITVINACLGLAVGLTMWAFGMPDPLLFGVIAWLFNYVPYVGALAGFGLAITVGLLEFDGLQAALLPGFAYYALTAVEGQFVTPYLVGRHLRLNTVVVFVAIAFWAWLWSVVGMLLAVPVLVTVRTVCGAVPHLQPVADFLSARGVEREKAASPGVDLSVDIRDADGQRGGGGGPPWRDTE